MKHLIYLFFSFVAVTGLAQETMSFDFGGASSGSVAVSPQSIWPVNSGDATFGLSHAAHVKAVTRNTAGESGSFLTSDQPFYFSAKLPEGNYRVTVLLGDPQGASNTTIKAENRRLFLYDHSLPEGKTEEVSFLVSVRSARINDTDSISLKTREFAYLNWDERLTLEFGGERPCVAGITIEPVKDNVPVVFLAGNSTVVDQMKEPYASWGQMFPLFFQPNVVIANYAESGETLKGFIAEKRLAKIGSQIKPGDYLFMEFAHNDQKPGGGHVEPWTTYQEYLMRFANFAREHGATPVMVTSTQRRNFDESGKVVNTLGDYPAAMRQLAEREGITLIDLNAMSEQLYMALGPVESKKALVHYPANSFPGQTEPLHDDTHFSTYGAWQLAKCVAEGVRQSDLGLKDHLHTSLPSYLPSNPDPVLEWNWPVSPGLAGEWPEGDVAPPRWAERINFDWKFIQVPVDGAEAENYDDASWQIVHLPHDASIYGPFYEDSLNSDRKNGFRPRLAGWYRKHLSLDFSLEGKKVWLEFEGVYRDAHVYVNGEEVAHQLNGYEGFLVDVTKAVKAGDNLIAVSYDNSDMESSRWYNGEGMYRDVWLHLTNEVHVAYNGTFVQTPSITEQAAQVFLQTEVVNETDSEENVTLHSHIYDPQGKLVAEQFDIAPLAAGELYTFRQRLNVANPVIWDLDAPNLYEVKTVVEVGKKVQDEYQTTFGIRTIEFNRDQGLLVNGRKVLAKGVNIHHDLGPLGAAAFERGIERRLEGLKRLGCNAIRLSHNPHDRYILDWCDRNGMLVFDEAFDKWEDQFFGRGNEFDDHWKASLEAFIRRDRNHPSVFLWSVGNETKQQRDPRADFGVPMLKEMVAFAHDLDPSRSVTCGLHPSRRSGAYRTENYYREGPPEMEFYMDVVSTNYREEFWPIDRANYPQLTFILSEAQVGNLGNEFFNFDHRSSVGLFYWGGTDYIGESFGWPAKGWPNGIIDWNDHWKPFSYYIQSLYSEEPMVHITAYDPSSETVKYWNEVNLRFQPMFSHWNWAGKDSVRLMTFSNAQEVELFINGQSMGVKQVPEEYYTKDIRAYTADEYDPDNPINTGPALHKELEWLVPYTAGKVEAVARINGEEVARHELHTAGKAHHIVLEPDRTELSADGLDLSYLTVRVVDKEGRTVPDATHDIQFEVTGAGTNAGVGNADIISDEPFQADHRRVFQGKALLVVRSGRKPGTITVSATGRKLKSASVMLKVVE